MKYYNGYFKELKNEIVQWIRDWFDQNGPGCNAIVGISGGKDSSVVAALCVEALGKDRVIGVLMPQGQQKDIYAAYKLVNFLILSLTRLILEIRFEVYWQGSKAQESRSVNRQK